MAICVEELIKDKPVLARKLEKLIEAVGEKKAYTLINNGTVENNILNDSIFDDLFEMTGSSYDALILLARKYNSLELLDKQTLSELYPEGIYNIQEGVKGSQNDFVKTLSVKDAVGFVYGDLKDKFTEMFTDTQRLGFNSLDEYLGAVKTIEDLNSDQIFEVLSELVTAAVDNAKLLILGKLGLSESFIRPVSIAVSYGVPISDAIELIMDKDIQNIVKDYEWSISSANKDKEKFFKSLDKYILESPAYESILSKVTRAENSNKSLKAENKSLANMSYDIDDFDGDLEIVSVNNYDDIKSVIGNKTPIIITNNIIDKRAFEKAFGGDFIEYNALDELIGASGKRLTNKIDLSNVILIHKEKLSNKRLKEIENDIKNENKFNKAYTKQEAEEIIKANKKLISNNNKVIKVNKNHKIHAVLDMLKLSNETGLLNKVSSLKNNTITDEFDVLQFIKQIESAVKRLNGDSKYEFSLLKFVSDSTYAALKIKDLQDNVKFVNPLLSLVNDTFLFNQLKSLMTQDHIAMNTNSVSIVTNTIMNEMYSGKQEKWQRNDIENTLYAYAISEFLKENAIKTTYDNKVYDLATNRGINDLMEDMPKVVEDLKERYNDNYFVQSLDSTSRVYRGYVSEKQFFLVDMLFDNKFQNNIYKYEAGLDNLPSNIKNMLMYYSLITKRSFKGSRNLATLFNSTMPEYAKFNDFIQDYDFGKFSPARYKKMPVSIYIGMVLNNTTLFKKANFKSEMFKRDRYEHVLFNMGDKYKDVVLVKRNAAFSVPTLNNSNSVEEHINNAGWQIGYDITVNGEKARLLKEVKGSSNYLVEFNNGSRDEIDADALFRDNPKMKFKGSNFGYMSLKELNDPLFNPTVAKGSDIGVFVDNKMRQARAKGNKYMFIKEVGERKVGDILESYYDDDLGTYVNVVFTGTVHNGNYKALSFKSVNSLTKEEENELIHKGAVYGLAELRLAKVKRMVKYSFLNDSFSLNSNKGVLAGIHNNAIEVVINKDDIGDKNLEKNKAVVFDNYVLTKTKEYNSLQEFMEGRFDKVKDALMYLGINERELTKDSYLANWLNNKKGSPYVAYTVKNISEEDLYGTSIDEYDKLVNINIEENKDELKDYSDDTVIISNMHSQEDRTLLRHVGLDVTSKDELHKNTEAVYNDIKENLNKLIPASLMSDLGIKKVISDILHSDNIYNNTYGEPKPYDIKDSSIVLAFAKKHNLKSFDEILDFIKDNEETDKDGVKGIVEDLRKKISFHNLEGFTFSGNKETYKLAKTLDIIAKEVINVVPGKNYYVFSSTKGNWFKFNDGKYDLLARVPVFLNKTAYITSIKGDDRLVDSLVRKSINEHNNNIYYIGRGLVKDRLVDLSLTVPTNSKGVSYDSYKVLKSSDLLEKLNKSKVSDNIDSKLINGIITMHDNDLDSDVKTIIDTGKYEIREYEADGAIVLVEKDGYRFIVLDTDYKGKIVNDSAYLTIGVQGYRIDAKVAYTSEGLFDRRALNVEENNEIEKLRNDVEEVLNGNDGSKGLKQLFKEIRAVADVDGKFKFTLDKLAQYFILDEVNIPNEALPLKEEFLTKYDEYNSKYKKYIDYVKGVEKTFSNIITVPVENYTANDIEDNKNIIPVYYRTATGSSDQTSKERKRFVRPGSIDDDTKMLQTINGEDAAVALTITSVKSRKYNRYLANIFIDNLFKLANKVQNKDKIFYVAFPDNLNETVIEGTLLRYSGLAKAFASYIATRKSNSSNFRIPNNIKFNSNANVAIQSTNGSFSIFDIDSNKVYEVLNDSDDRLFEPRIYNVEDLKMNNGLTLLEVFNDKIGVPLNTPFNEIMSNTYSTSKMQEILNQVFKDYFNEDPSRLTKLMLDVKGKDFRRDKGVLSISMSLANMLNSINQFDFIFAKDGNKLFKKQELSKNAFVATIDSSDKIFNVTQNGIDYVVKETAVIKNLFNNNVLDNRVLKDIVIPILKKGKNKSINIDKNKSILALKDKIEEMIINNNEFELSRTNLKYLRDVFSGKLPVRVFSSNERNVDINTTDELMDSKVFAEKLREVDFHKELGDDLAYEANAILLMTPKSSIFSRNSRVISDEGTRLLKKVGNVIPTGDLTGARIWVKAPRIESNISVKPTEYYNAFTKMKPILDFYIKNEVEFVVPVGSGIYEYVREYLIKNGYSFEQNDVNNTSLLTINKKNEYTPISVMPLFINSVNSNSSTYTVNNSIIKNGSSEGTFGGVVLEENPISSSASVNIDASKISDKNSMVDIQQLLSDINFDKDIFIKDKTTDAFNKAFFNKLNHEKTLAKRIAAFIMFNDELSNITKLSEYSKKMKAILATGSIESSKYIVIENEIDKLFDYNNVAGYNVVGSHRNTFNYVISLLKDNNIENVDLEGFDKHPIIGTMISESLSLEKSNASGLFKKNNHILSPLVEQDEMSLIDALGLLTVLDRKTKVTDNYIDNRNVIDQLVNNGISVMKVNDKYVVFDTSKIIVDTASSMEKVTRKKTFVVKDEIDNILKDDMDLFNAYKRSSNKIIYSYNEDVYIPMILDGEVVEEKYNTDDKQKIIKGLKKAIISRMFDSKYFDIRFIGDNSPMIRVLNFVLSFNNVPTFDKFSNPIKYIKGTDVYNGKPEVDKVYIRQERNEEGDIIDAEHLYITKNAEGSTFAFSNNGNIYSVNNGELEEISSAPVSNMNMSDKNTVVPKAGSTIYSLIQLENELKEGEFTVSSDEGTLIATDSNGDEYTYGSGVWEMVTNKKITKTSAYTKGHVGPVSQNETPTKLLSNDLVFMLDKPKRISSTEIKDGNRTFKLSSDGYNWEVNVSLTKKDKEKFRFQKDINGNDKKRTLTPFARQLKKKLFGNILTKIEELHPELDIRTMSSNDIKTIYGAKFANKKGFTKNGIIVYNTDLMTLDTPIHELGHIYLTYLKKNNITLYNDIIKESLKNSYSNDIRNAYPELTEEEIGEEVFVTLMGYESQGLLTESGLKTFDAISAKTKGNSFFEFLINLFKRIFGIDYRNINISDSLSKLIKDSNDYVMKDNDLINKPKENAKNSKYINSNLKVTLSKNINNHLEEIESKGYWYKLSGESVRDLLLNKPSYKTSIITDMSLTEFVGIKNNDGSLTYTVNGEVMEVTNDELSETSGSLKHNTLQYRHGKITDYTGAYDRYIELKESYDDKFKYVAQVIANIVVSPENVFNIDRNNVDVKTIKETTDKMFMSTDPYYISSILKMLDVKSDKLAFGHENTSLENKLIERVKNLNERNIYGYDRKIDLLATMYNFDKDYESVLEDLLLSDEEVIDVKNYNLKSNAKKKINITFDNYGLPLENKLNGIETKEKKEDNDIDFLKHNLSADHIEAFVGELINDKIELKEVKEILLNDKIINKIC